MVRAAALVLLSVLLCGMQADRWVRVTESDSGSVWYVDTSRSTWSGTPRVWLRTDHSRDTTVTIRSSVRLAELDCQGYRFRILSLTVYYPDGTNQNYPSSYAVLQDVVPNTVMEGVADFVCAIARQSSQQ